MIDVEDFAPLDRELRKLKLLHPNEMILNGTCNRMIKAMREYPKNWDDGRPQQIERRAYIERGFMRGLAAVTEFQWTH